MATSMVHDVVPRLMISRTSLGAMKQLSFVLEHGLLAADDHGELAGEDEVDLLGRRGIRAGAAAGEEVREPDHELLRAAGFGAEQAQRGVVAVVRRLVRLGVGKALDLHQNFSPFSMR